MTTRGPGAKPGAVFPGSMPRSAATEPFLEQTQVNQELKNEDPIQEAKPT